MKRIVVLLFVGVMATLLFAAYQSLGTSAQEGASCSPTGAETVATDQPDYSPGETAHITGSGYASLCDVTVRVTRPDESVVTGDGSGTPGSDIVSTDDEGNFAYDYILDGIEGSYTVDVLGQDDTILASTTFTDVPVPLIYADAARTVRRAVFERGDTVYARATGLNASRSYRFEVLRPGGVLVQTSSCFTGVTEKDDSYTILPFDPLSSDVTHTWAYKLREFPSSTTCAGTGSTAGADFYVAKAFAFDNATDRNNCTAEPCVNAKTYFGPGSTVYIRVLGFWPSLTDINDTWIKPDTSTACANTAGADRPESDSSGRLDTSYPLLSPETPDAACPALATPPDQGLWQLNLVDPEADPILQSRRTVQLDAFTLGPLVADAAIVAQWVESCDDLNHNGICEPSEPTLPAPSEIPVSQDVPIVVMKTIHNYGPYGPVDLQTVKDVVAPPDCTVNPYQHVEQIHAVPVSVDISHTEPFTIHCFAPSWHTFTIDNTLSNKDPGITDPNLGNNTRHTDWTVAAVASADLEIVAQRTVVWPSDIDASEDVVVTLETDVRNNGSYGPVEAKFEGWLEAPTPCTALPALISQQVTLDASETQTIEQEFTIHCSLKCLRTFRFSNRITAKDLHIDDPEPADNEALGTLLPSIETWAQADVKIVSQGFVSPPARIDVSADVPVTLRKVLHNNGPYTAESVTVTVSRTATAPADCSINPPSATDSVALPYSVDVTVDETFTIHCSNPSSHTFSISNSVAITTIHVRDPNTGNNAATTGLTVAAYKYTDVKIVSQALVSPPATMNVSEDKQVTLHKVLHNNGGYGPVQVCITAQAQAPSGCTATPSLGNPTSATLPVSTDVLVDEVWTLHCSRASTHGFTFNDAIAITTPHVEDPTPGNNSKSTPLSVEVIANADVKIISQGFVSPPTNINISESVPVTLHKVLHNNGPYAAEPATVTITETATAPAGCTIDPPTYSTQVAAPYSVDVTVDEVFTIHCTQQGTHTFTVDNSVSEPKEPHIDDPNMANNTASTELTVEVGGLADVKVADQYLEITPTEIPVSGDVNVMLIKVLHNNGPYGPVHAQTVTDVTVPPDCTISPNPHIQRFWNVPVSVDILHHEPFIIHCSEPSEHTFVFDDEVTLTDPNAVDPEPLNNSQVTELTVAAVAEADVKITSVGFVNPPTKLPLGENVDITLRKHVHNNGPWTPVDIAINATAAAPTGCTVVPNSVPSSISAVPVSVDQVVDEVWTIRCTQTGLKTFVFDNSLDVATPHVSDPNPSNSNSHKLLSVMDDASADADLDGDGLNDAVDPCLSNPDCDADGVSDGLLDPDGEGPVVAGPDNCPLAKNASQADFDEDGIGDACDPDDSDADGFLDGVELYVGTDPLATCAGPSHDAWPLDINMDGVVTAPGDVLAYAGRIGQSTGPPPSSGWRQRLDLNADGVLTAPGDVLKFAGKIAKTCG